MLFVYLPRQANPGPAANDQAGASGIEAIVQQKNNLGKTSQPASSYLCAW